MLRIAALASLALCVGTVFGSSAQAYVVISSVQYGTGSQGQALLLDAYPAPAPGGRSVIMVHGGGWTGGSRDSMRPRQVCKALQERGAACFSIDYELAPAARWPVQLANLRAALAWVQANAGAYNGNGADVSAWGLSAGAHLALMLAYREPGLQSVIGWSSPTDLTTWGRRHRINLLGCDCPSQAYDLSPLYAAHASAPPTLLAHATGDSTVPYWQSERLAERLSELGVPHRLDTYSGSDHAGTLFGQAFEASYEWWSGSS